MNFNIIFIILNDKSQKPKIYKFFFFPKYQTPVVRVYNESKFTSIAVLKYYYTGDNPLVKSMIFHMKKDNLESFWSSLM